MLARFIENEDGATSIEYAMIAVIVSVGIVASVQGFVGSLSNLFDAIVTGVQSVTAG